MTTAPATTAPVARLHYLYDPLCGWCYAVAPLIATAARLPGLAIELHAGGMMAGAQRRHVGRDWREYVLPHDRRIAQLSGQPFGEAYFDGLLLDEAALLDSEPPIAAVLAAHTLGGRGLELLQRIQRAHYQHGRRIAEPATLRALALELGLDGDAFDIAFAAQLGAPSQAHIEASRGLLRRLGGHGFPTVALEVGGSTAASLDIGRYLGQPEAWRAHLLERLAGLRAAAPAAFGCAADGCALPA
ncbi:MULTISPECIES: DsbA family protein [Lysobacter]|uniref:DsbA family protein n=1 Tax=Lysobacter firmicutimachus TaxID=1792846 RepID=A0ABU8D8W7_9GAMM|nr:DsbA family protein [Lysobacter antibioticus]